jgi:hypothetical protein
MNLLFLVEGKKTEREIYKSWLKHLFPQLDFVAKSDQITTNCCRMVSSKGYPPPGGLIKDLIEDVKKFDNIDHFFICFDSEEDTYQERFDAVKAKLDNAKMDVGIDSSIKTKFHIIIQHCCIETWALGNARLPTEYPCMHNSLKLKEFMNFYNVLVDDPELMVCCPSKDEKLIDCCKRSITKRISPKYNLRTKPKFHKDYLREYLKKYGLNYKKNDPKFVSEKKYLDALKERCMNTGHLPSLKVFLDILDNL